MPGMDKKQTENRNPAVVIRETEAKYGLKAGTLSGKSVSRFISKARGEAISLLYGMGMSYSEIGVILKRDRTSIARMVKIWQKGVKKPGKTRKKA